MIQDELEVVRAVFEDIVGKPWFVEDGDLRSEFGVVLINAYKAGLKDKKKLFMHAMEIALRDYSRVSP